MFGVDVPRIFERVPKERFVGGVYSVDQVAGRCFAQKVAKICVMFFASKAISR